MRSCLLSAGLRPTLRSLPVRRLRLLDRSRACLMGTLALTLGPLCATTALAATLRGTVLDPDGRPVAGARVVASTLLGAVRESATGPDGRFEIADLSAGRYDVRVIADRMQTDPEWVTLAADDARDLAIRLRLSAVAESIIVSAAQIELPRSRSPQALSVITAADLVARQVETIADALDSVPGLSITRSGGRGALTSVFPRGGDPRYTLVLIDGIKVNSFGGGYDFAHVSVANIDRIEVVRGPQSALFGSEAIGAVIQIVTKRGGSESFDAVVEGGTLGTSRLAAGASGSAGRWSWGIGSERAESAGFTGLTRAGERV